MELILLLFDRLEWSTGTRKIRKELIGFVLGLDNEQIQELTGQCGRLCVYYI